MEIISSLSYDWSFEVIWLKKTKVSVFLLNNWEIIILPQVSFLFLIVGFLINKLSPGYNASDSDSVEETDDPKPWYDVKS